MEFIEWPKFMPQFYTAPNANLSFKNEYNYDIANSFSIAIGHCHCHWALALRTREKTRDFHVQKRPIYVIEYGISIKPIAYRL
jgi:hypothetical protein